MNQPLWGIDLGGTKVEGVVLESLANPSPLVRTRIDTEAIKGYEHIIGQIAKLVAELEKQSGLRPAAIGIGTPGVLDPTLLTMKNCNTTVLNGMPLKKDLEARLRLPIIMANDANCFALAETYWGAAKQHAPEARMVFGIILGTGVGGGIVIDGKIWSGRHGIAGEWGHNFLDESGGPCYCGKTGCVETVISGPALERYYAGLSGTRIRLKEIAARHRAGADPIATQTIDRLTHFFGKAVSVITNLLDPDLIVVGGGVGNLDELYGNGPKALAEFIFNNRVEIPLLRPSLGDSAGVFGAAALVVDSSSGK
ncbi:MAG: ROK family protein [Bacteroidota bacterium]|nr:ROK family protein [Bacteroidota bacterium]MDP4214692.1 ROK family protein [Bacteroidota bacterium]MDP4244337.1 ROK family protein [Bacteroidota bacterium]MDP4254903.1 ROK family protein [Bacteroidota bacterium]MDP4258899.1 ROK family protein [Bacteroidota bacterium]